MKILFLTSRLPYPMNRGDKLRSFNFLSRLSKKHSVTLLSFIESDKQLPYVEELKKYCDKVEVVKLSCWQSYLNCLLNIFSIRPLQVSYYNSKKMRDKVKKIIASEKFDGIYIHLFRMAQFAEKIQGVSRILDLCDAVSLHMKRTIKFNRGILWPVYLLEYFRIKRYERKIIKKFNEVILISENDKKEILGGTSGPSNIHIVPNGVDYEYFKPSPIDNHKIPRVAFLGYLSAFYNLDAVRYFYREIFPLIKERVPQIKFSIIGANCPAELKKIAREDNAVELFCDVKDTRPFLNQSLLFVCPLRIGSGAQNKILEAMSMGLPVVTTSIGYSGIGALKDREIVVVDEPRAFAERIIDLINDGQLRNEISLNARRFIENNYRWEDSISKIENLLQKY
ncbi:MAG: glycosyltransferase [Candidatus Omnitrophota bacterium]|nr:glycosyltransferase [Candidatus Omnitrophota bacterium]